MRLVLQPHALKRQKDDYLQYMHTRCTLKNNLFVHRCSPCSCAGADEWRSVTWSLAMKHVTRTTTNPNVYKYQHLFNKIMVRPCSRTRHYFTTNLFFFGFFPSLFVNTARFWYFHLTVHAKLWFAMSYFRVSGTVTTGIQHCFSLNIATLVFALSGCDDIVLVKHCQVPFT